MNSHIIKPPTINGKKYRWKIVIVISIILGSTVLACVIVLLLLPKVFINDYLKEVVENEFMRAYPEYSLVLSKLDINLFNHQIKFGDVEIQSKDTALSCRVNELNAKGIKWWQMIWLGSEFLGALDGIIVEAQSMKIKLNKENYGINSGKLTLSFRESLIIADSLVLKPFIEDSTFFNLSEFQKKRIRLSIPQIKIHGFSLTQQLQGKLFKASTLHIRDIDMNILVDAYKPPKLDSAKLFPVKKLLTSLKSKLQIDSINIENTHIYYAEKLDVSSKPTEGYLINCSGLNSSVKNSDVEITDVSVEPLLDKDQYFEKSKYGRTRITVMIPKLNLSGLSFTDLLEGDKYQAILIQIQDASVGIQVSMFKSKNKVIKKFPMPNEVLSEIRQIIHIDSFSVLNGHIEYGEYYAPNSKPAVIEFKNLNGTILGLTNDNNQGDTAEIHFSTEFMNGGIMEVTVRTPLTSPKFSLQSYGTMSRIQLIKLNTFLETAEHVRIKSGVVLSSSFNMTVDDGRARGTVYVEYKDFSLAFIDENTRSDKGIFNVITSFLANTFKFNTENLKDKKGKLKPGKINYKRKPDDTFMQVLWYSVRSGVAGVIGFPSK